MAICKPREHVHLTNPFPFHNPVALDNQQRGQKNPGIEGSTKLYDNRAHMSKRQSNFPCHFGLGANSKGFLRN